MTASERELRSQLRSAVPHSLVVRAAGSLGEGDLVWCLPGAVAPVILEDKSTGDSNFRLSLNRRTKDQWDEYVRLAQHHDAWYTVRFKRRDRRFYPVVLQPAGYPVLRRQAGLVLSDFIEAILTARDLRGQSHERTP